MARVWRFEFDRLNREEKVLPAPAVDGADFAVNFVPLVRLFNNRVLIRLLRLGTLAAGEESDGHQNG